MLRTAFPIRVKLEYYPVSFLLPSRRTHLNMSFYVRIILRIKIHKTVVENRGDDIEIEPMISFVSISKATLLSPRLVCENERFEKSYFFLFRNNYNEIIQTKGKRKITAQYRTAQYRY